MAHIYAVGDYVTLRPRYTQNDYWPQWAGREMRIVRIHKGYEKQELMVATGDGEYMLYDTQVQPVPDNPEKELVINLPLPPKSVKLDDLLEQPDVCPVELYTREEVESYVTRVNAEFQSANAKIEKVLQRVKEKAAAPAPAVDTKPPVDEREVHNKAVQAIVDRFNRLDRRVSAREAAKFLK